MSGSLSINLNLRPCNIVTSRLLFVLFVPFQTFFWFVNCTNLACEICIIFWQCQDHRHCLYQNVFSIDINREILFNCLLLFKLLWLVSKLCELSQQYILRQVVYFRAFNIVIYGKFHADVSAFQHSSLSVCILHELSL